MTRQELNDKMLALQQGDESAFEDIYNDTKRGLFAFIFSICRDYQTAEDMMQTAYVRLRTTIASYQAGGNAYAWLYTIAKNATLTELARRKREISSDAFDNEEQFGSYTLEERDSPTITVMSRVLNDVERQIVSLHVISGFKHREIAEMLQKSLGSVLWTYNNSLSKLKKALQRENDYES